MEWMATDRCSVEDSDLLIPRLESLPRHPVASVAERASCLGGAVIARSTRWSPSIVKYIRQSSLIRACQSPVRSSYFFARKEGWRRSRRRFVSCLPQGLLDLRRARDQVSGERFGQHGAHGLSRP